MATDTSPRFQKSDLLPVPEIAAAAVETTDFTPASSWSSARPPAWWSTCATFASDTVLTPMDMVKQRLQLGNIPYKGMNEGQTRTIQLSDDCLPHIFSYHHHIFTKYGENSFWWFGPWPKLNIVDPELIKEIMSKPDLFQKPFPETGKILAGGLAFLEGEKWAKHRKIVNPAFHVDKLKNMVPLIGLSCSNMIQKWKAIVSSNSEKGSLSEIDVWPFLEDLTGDVISRTAFGSSHEEGMRIFQLTRDKLKLTMQIFLLCMIPGWRYLPTKINRELKSMTEELQSLLRGMIDKRQKAMDRGETVDDFLGILMESNSRSIQEHGNKNSGMSIEDVMEECKLFYFSGSETTSSLLVWTMILLCQHPEWQTLRLGLSTVQAEYICSQSSRINWFYLYFCCVENPLRISARSP
ncbi:PREDICTED: cytochrome P450 CYP72A219-like [Erythranthe guttata]|uniref:cytochrome P450 CYP72A219-like n=1 Tax=Erythranthe guttata TaxID=4155 RepID=UPI00064DAA6C|nr:PREDICTED: cytochrome P450 CYP72A219-like [Erythranthe guttata]|eukprot:XP_012850548.1 PREDICTED: cytochrome P450 CYP72A219-like [Erythranthe guttata]